MKVFNNLSFCCSVLIVLYVGLNMSSCASNDMNFSDDVEALEAYQNFLHEIKGKEISNTDVYTADLMKFKQMTDTVYKFLKKDSVFLQEPNKVARFSLLHDSIKYELTRLTETWRYSYDDVVSIKLNTSSFKDDQELMEAVKEAEPFFLSLDSIQFLSEDKETTIARYRHLLRIFSENGVTSKNDMLSFIREEDAIFNSFLSHLYEINDEPVADITNATEGICNSIFDAARQGKIPAKDVMIYMSMRTVRRLLKNSAVCITDINKNQLKNKEQGNAYLWMILQPFICIDQFSIATITPQEKSNLNYIISQMQKSSKFAKTFEIDQRSLSYLLPQQLLKMYVLSL